VHYRTCLPKANEWSDVHLDFDPGRWRLACAAFVDFEQIFTESSKPWVFTSDRIEANRESENGKKQLFILGATST
jgi:hypothetical protein